jgi:Domain of unknown function (DUF3471)
MMSKPVRWWTLSASLLVCLAPVFEGVAAQGRAPSASSPATPQEITLDATTLKRYVGSYRLGQKDLQGVITVTASGTQLTIQMSGKPPAEVYAQTPTHFFLKVENATLDFVTQGNAPASALILHEGVPQGGTVDITLPRMDDALAKRFNDDLAARVRSNMPQPGTEAAVRDFFAHIGKGQPPDYSKMSAELAATAKQQESGLIGGVGSLGALQSITFKGVGPGGEDTYLVKFLTGALLLHINLDPQGIITGLALQPAQP